MFPIRDDNPTRRFSLVTILLILANALVFLWELSLGGGEALDSFYFHFGFVPGVLTGTSAPPSGTLSPYFLTVLTSMFVHGGWAHLLGNMLYLWIFGNNVEDTFGHGKFLVFYLLGGVVAALVQLLSQPSSNVPTIGASGAIAAIMGAYFYLYPRAHIQTLVFFIFITTIRVPAWIFLGLWFVMQLFDLTTGNAEGVAVWAHIGGFLFGLLAAWLFSRRRPREPEYMYYG